MTPGYEVDQSIAEAEATRVSLFVSEEERLALYKSVSGWVAEGKLDQVGASMKMIRDDLGSSDRKTREIAYSGYYTLVQALVDAEQSKALRSLMNAFPVEFEQIRETDLMVLHFNTLMLILDYFKREGELAPIVFGLNVIANIYQMNLGLAQTSIELAVEVYLDSDLFQRMLNLPKTDPLRKQIDLLFSQRGIRFLSSLLNALFKLEDRLHRKIILDYLIGMGPVIYDDLLEKLEQCLIKPTPWYVKRNLLHIMAVKPPIELLPFLKTFMDEPATKMQDLVHRCIYMIHSRSAFEMGKNLLEKAEGPELQKILSFIGLGKEKSYIPILITMYEESEDQAIKIDIINALGRLGGVHAIEFLMSLVAKTSLFGGGKDPFRAAAAVALSLNDGEEVARFLSKYVRDRNPEVREAACRFHGQADSRAIKGGRGQIAAS